MGRTLTNNLTAEQKEELLKHPEGKVRVLKLNENVVKQLTDSISNIKSEIKGAESMAISWISLTIVLTIFQILPLQTTEVRGFIFSCLPSFVILIYATAFALLKSPTNSKPDFAVVEKRI